MNSLLNRIKFISSMLLLAPLALSSEEHEHHHETHTDMVEISQEMLSRFDIQVAEVSSGVIRKTITTYGRLDASPETVSHIRARFPGQISKVYAAIGDELKEGDLLAVVESNESLRRYQIKSPINGTITRQHASSGDLAEDQILYEIADFSLLWAEIKLFPRHRHQLRPGMPVTVSVDEVTVETQLGPLIPSIDHSPYIISRSRIKNEGLRLYPGLLVEAEITVDEIEVAVKIPRAAIQQIENQSSVFVQTPHEDHFTVRPVQLGQQDKDSIEIIEGLEPGEQIVTHNSYLLRAELEKSGAEHHH